MFERILVVCIGNICRSPVAEALLRKSAPEGVTVESAGLGALVGSSADPASVELMQMRDIDITGHCARQLTGDMVREYDLILVMESAHQRQIHDIFPAGRGKVHLIGKWSEEDIPDPYKKSFEYFEHVIALIDEGVQAWVTKLWK